MASELECDSTTGTTVYFQVRNSVGLIWSTAGVAFEAYQTANIANYKIAATEQGSASGFFTATMPAAVAGEYNVIAKQQAGGSAAESDRTIAAGNVQWSGTAIVPLSAVGITSNIKKNQALANFEFLMTDSTNHAPATLKSVTVTRSIDGAAFAAGTLSAVTEVSNGIYRVDFAAADLNGNVVTLRATASACDDTFERIITQPAA